MHRAAANAAATAGDHHGLAGEKSGLNAALYIRFAILTEGCGRMIIGARCGIISATMMTPAHTP